MRVEPAGYSVRLMMILPPPPSVTLPSGAEPQNVQPGPEFNGLNWESAGGIGGRVVVDDQRRSRPPAFHADLVGAGGGGVD